ncbi:gamma carbonic anhydrase family protein [Falsirhodobacter algicola]|uniref:Gamma carbonic anhydrase family protein n=1 Tax=Falsirhodobacter algicola TaxID=2692330 RepID=A0A8J8MRP8_9RHOB|nr:gamma carbonic anhydrase family protein [Falsirhodobacter algicola]QUS35227.1 gamma carbonic anhydrase family protein [Falsirhodobacter algicola]
MMHDLENQSPMLPASGDVWVAPGAHVIGQVALGSGVGVWFGAVLRGDNEPIRVGEGSNIQDLCMLHTDLGFPLTVGAECTVGHGAILHGCTLGDGTLIGMGAVVMNGARIGEECLIGARALVTEGREIPAGSLVLGSPAKVVRALTPEERAGLRASAARYRQNMRRFREGLTTLGG